MSRQVDTSDPSKLTEDELRYAHDRYLITDEQFEECLANLAGDGGGSPGKYDAMSGDELKAEVESRGDRIDASKLKSRKAVIAALEADDKDNA